MLPLVILALLAGAEGLSGSLHAAGADVSAAPSATTPSRDAPPPAPAPRPSVLRDAALAAAASAAVALGKPDIRRAIFRDASLGHVLENFAFPIAQVRAGTRRDTDPFWVNNVAHPVSFAVEALYLKHQGYGNGEAFLFTQVHSVVWEFVVEGCAFEPSGKDLAADAIGAAAAIWIVHPLVRRWIGPHPARESPASIDVGFIPIGGGAALQLTARF